ncbi:hypothetical protein R1T16_11165 [Flavobacterium sp. DG1-102-2]|nr:hypothetical protein [Flavobacterium sp. DG1-102-2]MDV6168988.1 hypothetical protein [Flavobacterium sp. DG1-102-2]
MDDISEDPEVMDVQLGLGLNNEFIMKSGVTLSKLIIERIDDLKKRS